ncbi:MAG: SAM-dependent methyltransferase [Pseudohongiellaceae bacterium]
MNRREISSEHVAGLSSVDHGDYWWYAVRQGHVLASLRRRMGQQPVDHLDLGCGAGGVMAALGKAIVPRSQFGLDGTEEAVEIAKARGLDAEYADFRQPLTLPFVPNLVTCLDVLEHLEDPVLALRNLGASVTKEALLVVTVPAMPSLHSAWDDLCGHYRRYTRKTITEHLHEGGFEPLRIRYAFSYCVPPAWWQRRVTKTVQEVEFPEVSPLLNRLLTWAGTGERALSCPMPFGTTLVAEARPKG